MSTLPNAIVKAALAKGLNVWQCFDSRGERIAYFLRVTPEWCVYRNSVRAMLSLIRKTPARQP